MMTQKIRCFVMSSLSGVCIFFAVKYDSPFLIGVALFAALITICMAIIE